MGKAGGHVLSWATFGKLTGFGVGGLLTGAAATVYEVGSLAYGLRQCGIDCQADPQSHCCTEGQVKWSPGGSVAGRFIAELLTQCYTWRCGPLGTWVRDGARTCVTGTRCVASVDGPGCVDCDERSRSLDLRTDSIAATASGAGSTCSAADRRVGGSIRCRDLELRIARDPNEISGPAGDLLPGQRVEYVIEYENVGDGRAFDVYLVNDLPDALDESTVVIGDGGWLVASTRQLVWYVGELGPQGDPDSLGEVSYSIEVRQGLPSGTPIANQAVVHFPSVPEITPTNVWVNLVAPLAAIPQTLETDYEQPLSIVLEGREISNLPLSFEIVEWPIRGQLDGVPPNVTYRPGPGMVGEDSFRFVVDNGVSQSRPAAVSIQITSDGDEDAPQVLRTIPEANATGVAIGVEPLFVDDDGAVYLPVISVVVSEALNPETVTSSRVVLERSDGSPVLATVRFDATTNRLVLAPRSILAGNTSYTVRVLEGLTDLAGNALAPLSWSFVTGSAPAAQDRIFSDRFEGVPSARR